MRRRRPHDRRHLQEQGRDIRPWILEGREIGRGPDDEPLVECIRPAAWLSAYLVEEAEAEVAEEFEERGSLIRGRAGG